jgi:FkbM family methyltransferase
MDMIINHRKAMTFASMALSLIFPRVPELDPDISPALVGRLVKPGNVVIEVGSNKGGLTMLISAIVGSTGKVIAIEPNPFSYAILSFHCRRSSNVIRLGLAVGAFEGEASLFLRGPTDKAASLLSGSSNPLRIGIKFTTLDILIERLGLVPDVVFIDAEGAELDVLNGAHKTLDSFVSLVVVLRRTGLTKFDDAIELMRIKKFKPIPLTTDSSGLGLYLFRQVT